MTIPHSANPTNPITRQRVLRYEIRGRTRVLGRNRRRWGFFIKNESEPKILIGRLPYALERGAFFSMDAHSMGGPRGTKADWWVRPQKRGTRCVVYVCESTEEGRR